LIIHSKGPEALAGLIRRLGIRAGPVWVKVNWTAPAPGMFTSPAVLEEVLDALPRPVVLLEGHSVGRLLVRIADLPEDEEGFRAAVREGDRAFLKRTGLEEIVNRPDVGYLNVTESYWSGDVVSPADVQARVQTRFGDLHYENLTGVVPDALYRGARRGTLVNLARMKVPDQDSGDWSLALKNMFGLIPDPYRIRYHREGLAEAIIDINRVYRALFQVVDIVEGLESVVVYSEEGAYRAPWGHYDLMDAPRLLAFGENPVDLEKEIAAHFGRDLTGRRLLQLGAEIF